MRGQHNTGSLCEADTDKSNYEQAQNQPIHLPHKYTNSRALPPSFMCWKKPRLSGFSGSEKPQLQTLDGMPTLTGKQHCRCTRLACSSLSLSCVNWWCAVIQRHNITTYYATKSKPYMWSAVNTRSAERLHGTSAKFGRRRLGFFTFKWRPTDILWSFATTYNIFCKNHFDDVCPRNVEHSIQQYPFLHTKRQQQLSLN